MSPELARRAARLGLLTLTLVPTVTGCDDRQAFHAPEPGLERMLQQRRADPYAASSFFADGRVMRMPPEFSVAREQHLLDARLQSGRDERGYLTALPVPLSRPLLLQGRAAFERVCATCHGVLGDGVSVVAEKMELRKPPSLHEPRLVALSPGQTFEVISLGYGLMPALAPLLDLNERWAVVAYLRALRLSQSVPVATLPAALQGELRAEAP